MPQLALVDLGDSTEGLRVIELLGQEAPEMVIIVVGPTVPADTLLQIMRSGASEYLPRPFEGEELVAAFHRARRRVGTSAEDGSARGSLTTLFSPKGGVGVTTVAANLSVALQQITGEDTILIDLAPSLGTTALSMGIQARYSYLDIVQNFHRMDKELLNSFLETHESGVRVLASPISSDQPEGPAAEAVAGLLRLCRRHFRNVVVDAGHTLTNGVDAALMESDHRIFVATPELPTLRNVRRALHLTGGPESNGALSPILVLNQFREGTGLTAPDIEDALGLSAHTVVDYDDTVTESINLGLPAVLSGRSKFARSIMKLGSSIAGPEYAVPSRGGLMQLLSRPFRSPRPLNLSKESN
jgi:pilus assembly protein CpaE